MKAGFLYFAVVFAVGFVLGTIRVLLLSPHLGSTTAVMIELPIILAAAWFSCRWIILRLQVPRDSAARMVMGGVAFALTIAAELILGYFGFGRSVTEMLAAFATSDGALGLLGQIVFAVLPVAQLRAKG